VQFLMFIKINLQNNFIRINLSFVKNRTKCMYRINFELRNTETQTPVIRKQPVSILHLFVSPSERFETRRILLEKDKQSNV